MSALMPKASQATQRFIAQCAQDCQEVFAGLEEVERANTAKVLGAFQGHDVSARNFAPTNGYGYDDVGRDALGAMFAQVMGCEAALVRPQIASGTHALALCLQGVLRPGDVLLSAAGVAHATELSFPAA